MDTPLNFLYKQIQDQRISDETAVKQIEKFKAEYRLKNNQKVISSSDLMKKYDFLPEVYAYDKPYLKDHTVYDQQVILGVTHASLAINAFFKIFPQENSVTLKD